ncbi:hypothetical protein K502DRAFT_343024 [Neoconidiobolus thromboides FSU 785]|nr:hypothetical protein K502DRAFT_343024 [Neoconidiobolus thromboides FSU 785]
MLLQSVINFNLNSKPQHALGISEDQLNINENLNNELEVYGSSPTSDYIVELPSYIGSEMDSNPMKEVVEDELLPNYSYSIFNEGYLYLKKENSSRSFMSKKWELNYFILQGTSLRIYEYNPNLTHYGINKHRLQSYKSWNLSQCNINWVNNHTKYDNVVRVTMKDNSTYLIRTKERSKLLDWLKDLKAAIVLSVDIDQRSLYCL